MNVENSVNFERRFRYPPRRRCLISLLSKANEVKLVCRKVILERMIELYCFQVSFKFSLRSNDMNLGKNVKGENLTDFVQLVVFYTVLLICMCKRWMQSN